jgi:hypothetical protein
MAGRGLCLATKLICIQQFFIGLDGLMRDIADGVTATTDMYTDNTDSLKSTTDTLRNIVGGIPA